MKKLEVIIRPEKLEDIKSVLNQLDIKGMSVTTILGCGNQKGSKQVYRGKEMEINLLHKLKVEVVVNDDKVEALIEKASDAVKTGAVGDGKIFISAIEDAVRIRTGERGDKAI